MIFRCLVTFAKYPAQSSLIRMQKKFHFFLIKVPLPNNPAGAGPDISAQIQSLNNVIDAAVTSSILWAKAVDCISKSILHPRGLAFHMC